MFGSYLRQVMDAMPTTRRTVLTGLAGLAVAMGIGRFALTPLLPLLQADGLTLSQGAWLADANYLGYVLGALACLAWNPTPSRAARGGLVAVSLFTLGMALSPPFVWSLLLRLAAGVASAFVLVGISAWALGAMVGPRRTEAAGGVYAGVGIGIIVAGLAAMAVGLAGETVILGWWLVGGIAAAVTAGTWRSLRLAGSPPTAVGKQEPARSSVTLVACYGAFGFGYILPATLLPAMARELVADPAVFGWTWPIFGAAAAVSTWVCGALLRYTSPRVLWAFSQLVMAVWRSAACCRAAQRRLVGRQRAVHRRHLHGRDDVGPARSASSGRHCGAALDSGDDRGFRHRPAHWPTPRRLRRGRAVGVGGGGAAAATQLHRAAAGTRPGRALHST